MEDISLGTKSGFKNMLKLLQKSTDVTKQDTAGNNIVTNTPAVLSARSKQCYYALLLWIKIMSVQDKFVAPGGFNDALLTEYCKLCHTRKESGDKETENIVSNPDRFT